jgi:hypothetical protein
MALMVAAVAAGVGCGDDDSGTDVGGDADVAEDATVPDDGAVDTDHDVPVDVPPDVDPDGVTDTPGEDGTVEPTTLEGVVWSYYYTELTTPPLGLGWGSGAVVSTVGLGTEVSATAGSSGEFALADLPIGETIMLRATGLDGHHAGLTRLFEVESGEVEFLALPTRELVTRVAAPAVWDVTVDSTKGLLAGLIATWDPTADPPVTGFIGDATVSITPAVAGADYKLVYFNPLDVSDTTRTGTHPAQSLFFAVNLPPRGPADPYEMTITATGRTFPTIRFAIEADVMTYVLVKAE